jgi:hypothetical protein
VFELVQQCLLGITGRQEHERSIIADGSVVTDLAHETMHASREIKPRSGILAVSSLKKESRQGVRKLLPNFRARRDPLIVLEVKREKQVREKILKQFAGPLHEHPG